MTSLDLSEKPKNNIDAWKQIMHQNQFEDSFNNWQMRILNMRK